MRPPTVCLVVHVFVHAGTLLSHLETIKIQINYVVSLHLKHFNKVKCLKIKECLKCAKSNNLRVPLPHHFTILDTFENLNNFLK